MKPAAIIRLLLCSLLAGGLAAVPANAQTDMRWKPETAAVQRGGERFAAACGFCHGKDARGSERGPDLLRSELVNRDEKGELIGDVLRQGRPQRGMPAFPDLAGQAPDLADFLHERIGAIANRMAYAISTEITGDARAGARYFRQHCRACHSGKRDLTGIGQRYKPDLLRAMIAWPGPDVISYVGFDLRPVKRPPVGVTVTLPSGQTVRGTALFIGEFDVALRDQGGAFHSFARSATRQVAIDDPLTRHRELLSLYRDADLQNLVAYLVGLK